LGVAVFDKHRVRIEQKRAENLLTSGRYLLMFTTSMCNKLLRSLLADIVN